MHDIHRKDFTRVFKGASVYGLGKLLTKLISFFLLPLYTVYLSPSDYGILATVNIFGSILLIICMFSFDGAFARYYYDYKDDEKVLRKYLGTLINFILLFNLLLMFLLIIFKGIIFTPFLPENKVDLQPYIILQLGIVYFGLISSFLTTLYQVQEKPSKYVIFSLVGFVLSVALVIYFVVFQKMGAYGSLLGSLIASMIIFFVSIYLLWHHFSINLHLPFLKDSFRYGVPVTLHILFGWLLGYADRIILLKYVSLSELGLYYFALQIGLVMYFIVESVNQAWTPFFFDTMKNRTDASSILPKLVQNYYVAMVTIALIGILFNKEILTLFTNARYHSSLIYIPFLILNFLIAGFYFMNINTLYYFKKTKLIPIITLSAAGVKIIFAFMLIPYFSVWGAVISTIIATLFWSITVYIVANKLYKINYQFGLLFRLFVVFNIIFVLSIIIPVASVYMSLLFKTGLLILFLALIIKNKIINAAQLKILLSFNQGAIS